MEFILSFTAQFLYLVIVSVGIIVFFFYREKKNFAIFAIPALVLSYILAKVLGSFIKSPRPFITQHIRPLIPTATDNGFPSDHTLLAMTVALIVFTYNKKVGIVLILLAVCVGVARVMTHSHHIIDIVGSTAIALFSILLVVVARKWYNKFI